MSRFYVMCALTESELGNFDTLELASKFVSQLDFSKFKPETDIYIHDTDVYGIEYIICYAGDDIIFVERYEQESESYIYCHASDYDDGYVFF